MKPQRNFSRALTLVAEDLRQSADTAVSEDEILAYLNHELSEKERLRVDEALALDPEAAALARDLASLPDAAGPGEAAYLSPEDLAQDWKKIQARVSPLPAATVLPFRPRWRPALGLAAAASLLIALAAWVFFERSGRLAKQQQLAAALAPQLNVETHLLFNSVPRGAAGSGPQVFRLAPGAEVFLLKLSPRERPELTDYRLEVRAQDRPQDAPLWQAEGLKLYADGAFSLALPRQAFRPGRYELRVVGKDSAGEQAVESFLIEIPER